MDQRQRQSTSCERLSAAGPLWTPEQLQIITQLPPIQKLKKRSQSSTGVGIIIVYGCSEAAVLLSPRSGGSNLLNYRFVTSICCRVKRSIRHSALVNRYQIERPDTLDYSSEPQINESKSHERPLPFLHISLLIKKTKKIQLKIQRIEVTLEFFDCITSS